MIKIIFNQGIKRLLISSLLVVFAIGLYAQNTSGIIKYDRKSYWIKIMKQLPWMTAADIERNQLTWGKNQGRPTPHELYFVNDKSVYQRVEKEGESTGWSRSQEEYTLIRDYKSKKSEDIVETLGKKYVIEGLPTYKWKILNEIKEVGGYLCMKAETTDDVKDQTIHAWFADAIPVQGGPEGFYGLPGMILEIDINDGATVITATEVEINQTEIDLPIPKKISGKKIDRVKFNEISKKFIEDSFKSKRNPFWTLRY